MQYLISTQLLKNLLKSLSVIALAFFSLFSPKVDAASDGSPTWEIYDDDQKGAKIETPFDSKHLCISDEKRRAIPKKTYAATNLVSDEAKKVLQPFFIDNRFTSDEYKNPDAWFFSKLCTISTPLYDSGCDFSKLKITMRLKTLKMGYANEGPHGHKYITHLAVSGCNKLPGKITKGCYYSMDLKDNQARGFQSERPLPSDEFDSFIWRCSGQMDSIGDPKEERFYEPNPRDAAEILESIHRGSGGITSR